MTTSENQTKYYQSDDFRKTHKNNRIGAGIVIILIGLVILARQAGLFFVHMHVWPVILIAIGLYMGVKHKFRHMAAWILIIIGSLNLIPHFELMGVQSRHLVAPVLLIAGGLFMIFRPKRMYHHRRYYAATGVISDDDLDIAVSFGERRAIVTSRNFKGGNISNSFGSTTVNLLQADATEPMVLDLRVSFGSVEIIVPSHWDLQIELQPTLGSVEDNRFIHTAPGKEKKLLILKGSCSFGSIEIKSA